MKEVVGFPMYTLSSNGDIKSKYTGKTLRPVIDGTGYPIVSLVNKEGKFKKSVHRLVALHFIPNPENKPHVNHIDGDKTNYHVSNLEWVTQKENAQHALKTGLLDSRIEGHYTPVIKVCLETGKDLEEYRSMTFAAKSNNLIQQNISKVCHGVRKSCGGYGWRFK